MRLFALAVSVLFLVFLSGCDERKPFVMSPRIEIVCKDGVKYYIGSREYPYNSMLAVAYNTDGTIKLCKNSKETFSSRILM